MDHHGRSVVVEKLVAVQSIGVRDDLTGSVVGHVEGRQIACMIRVDGLVVVALQVAPCGQERSALAGVTGVLAVGFTQSGGMDVQAVEPGRQVHRPGSDHGAAVHLGELDSAARLALGSDQVSDGKLLTRVRVGDLGGGVALRRDLALGGWRILSGPAGRRQERGRGECNECRSATDSSECGRGAWSH